jgi:hypothetical protein
MSRVFLVLAVALAMAAMIVVTVAPAFAQGRSPGWSPCEHTVGQALPPQQAVEGFDTACENYSAHRPQR